jgi:hypothetical protein
MLFDILAGVIGMALSVARGLERGGGGFGGYDLGPPVVDGQDQGLEQLVDLDCVQWDDLFLGIDSSPFF